MPAAVRHRWNLDNGGAVGGPFACLRSTDCLSASIVMGRWLSLPRLPRSDGPPPAGGPLRVRKYVAGDAPVRNQPCAWSNQPCAWSNQPCAWSNQPWDLSASDDQFSRRWLLRQRGWFLKRGIRVTPAQRSLDFGSLSAQYDLTERWFSCEPPLIKAVTCCDIAFLGSVHSRIC